MNGDRYLANIHLWQMHHNDLITDKMTGQLNRECRLLKQ